MKSAFRSMWIAGMVCCCTLAVPSAGPGRRLFVEPFTTKTAPEKLREYVMAELSKLPGVSLVASEAGAEDILGGGGEIWVKGYRSLNPRSGRLPSDGTPVYGGYLSVELKNGRGETWWSYLATPENDAGDISKELAKRIAKHVAAALEQDRAPSREMAPPQSAVALRGAGATFPAPVYAKWAELYRAQTGIGIRPSAKYIIEGGLPVTDAMQRACNAAVSQSPRNDLRVVVIVLD